MIELIDFLIQNCNPATEVYRGQDTEAGLPVTVCRTLDRREERRLYKLGRQSGRQHWLLQVTVAVLEKLSGNLSGKLVGLQRLALVALATTAGRAS